MSKLVGMSRNINLEWLNKTAELVMEEKSNEEIKEELKEYLSVSINSPTNLRKTREILMHIWIRFPEELLKLKSLALSLVKSHKLNNKLVAHWCMILITFPVFGDIATVIGKMKDKQIEITSSQISNKIFDKWGERSTLVHTIPKNIKTMKDIGVLEQIKVGKYDVNKVKIEDEQAVILIIATLLFLKDKLYVSLEELINCYEVYPFQYDINIEGLQTSEFFSFDKFGGELVVSLKKCNN